MEDHGSLVPIMQSPVQAIKNTTTEPQQQAWQLPMVGVKEEFHTADKSFTTFSRFYSKIIAFLLAMDGNMVTKDFPNIILK